MRSPIYVAGPMFSRADKRQQMEIVDELELQGYQTYVAHRDGIEVAEAMEILTDDRRVPVELRADILDLACKAVFALDVFQIVERCQGCVFNLDGRVPDEGAMGESSIAYATGKPVVLFRTTTLSLVGGRVSPLVQGLGNWRFVSDPRHLAIALERGELYPTTPAPHLAATVRFGAKVWGAIDYIHEVVDERDTSGIVNAYSLLEESWADDVDVIWPRVVG